MAERLDLVKPAKSESDDDFTHYVHLADGRILREKITGVRHTYHQDSENGEKIPVIGVYPRTVE